MSGEEIGYDPARWRAWLDALPADWRGKGGGSGAEPEPGILDEPKSPGVFSDGPAQFFGIRSSTRAAVYCVQGSAAWEQVREEVKRSIGTLPDGSLFGVVVYAGEAKRFKGSLVLANATNGAAVGQWLDDLEPGPGADLHAGLLAALALAGTAADTMFVAAITGAPEGTYIEDPRHIVLEATARNALQGIRIHAFGPSAGRDSFYLQHLCLQFSGSHVAP
jgi:hypothetical protein